ncbi:hypothetical protein [Glycomyces tenuis]|uniref:hypothetical protein n=1 Tax=Glycomyces tenuis TaxID=58116 RepID=UPI0003FC41FE|nr:hypothetical protein [Glycomyces tenuis]
MATSSESVFTDLDEYVTLRSADGVVTVEVSAAGFRQPPGEIARLITELAKELPRPGAEDDAALASGIDALDQLQQAASTGGYEGFTAIMRQRLGIEDPIAPLGPDPEFDRAIAGRLDGILTTMRGAADARGGPPPEILTAEAASDEGDLAVTSSSERVVAAVRIEPHARRRGVEGLGEALTSLLARARERLRELGEERARRDRPDVAEQMDNAPQDAERAGRSTAAALDRIAQFNETIQRKAGGR